MAFRLVSSGGFVADPAMVSVYASGTVRSGMVVDFDHTNNRVIPAGTASTSTTIFGVCLDYAQGASDTLVRVIPFAQGQMWEGDCVSTAATIQLGRKVQLYSDSRFLQNTSYDQSGVTGVFFAYQVAGGFSGSGRLQGEFVRMPMGYPANVTTFN